MMEPTRIWLIRHALVDENARAILYGTMDVELCPATLIEQAPMYRALAQRLPRPAKWFVTPLAGPGAPPRRSLPPAIRCRTWSWRRG